MTIKRLTLFLLISCFLFGIPRAGIAGQITGTVVGIGARGGPAEPIENIQADFFDALNAELLGSSVTGATGMYKSGIIPDVDYVIRFTDIGTHSEAGLFVTKFSGTEFGYFCEASVIPVLSGGPVIVDEELVWTEPSLVVVRDFEFRGSVADGSNLAPLPGIQVNFLVGETGDLITSQTTDVNGSYGTDKLSYVGFSLARFSIVKIRYVDPTGVYFPEYQGSYNTDDFCAGTDFLEPGGSVVGFMDRMPPDENPQVLIDAVESLNLPNNVSTMLGTPLSRAVDLLTDSNPNNDTAVCKQLASFISRLDIQERNGRLSASDAEDLRQSTEALSAQLGC